MTAHAHADSMNERATANFSLTPGFSPVITGSCERKPFKRLFHCGRASTRLKSGVNEK